MVRTPTTFVVGAGASKPFHLPLGSDLLTRSKRLEASSYEYQLVLWQTRIEAKRFNEVLADLSKYPGPSIDDYLEKRRHSEDTQRIGRALIAAFMGVSIRGTRAAENSKPEPKQDWIKYIVRQMVDGASTFDQFVTGNAVRFVTFNFDSIIEERLHQLVSTTYDVGYDAQRLREAVPVIHVHGRLPPPPLGPPSTSIGDVNNEWVTWLGPAAESIKVTADEIEASALSEARAAVESAEVLCFLGFSYHLTNLERLNIPGLRRDKVSRVVFGSAFGLPAGERLRVIDRLMPAAGGSVPQLGGPTDTCVDVLEAFHVFRD
jgi:hypothetical protein